VRLLVTRPEPDAERTAAVLRQRGHEVIVAALLHIESIANAELGSGPWSAVVVTSANAIRAIKAHPRRPELAGLRLFAVGRRTATAARAAGFAEVIAAGGDTQELVRSIGQSPECKGQPLLYLAGEDRSGDLAGDLAAQGFVARTVVVYRAAKAKSFPPAIGAALAAGQIDGVLHFSRRSAEAYLDCATAAGLLARALRPSHYCLSGQIAEPLATAGAAHIRIAGRPEETVLIDLIAAETLLK
jgi:uroporphyrinogen-III synthase